MEAWAQRKHSLPPAFASWLVYFGFKFVLHSGFKRKTLFNKAMKRMAFYLARLPFRFAPFYGKRAK